ncbi:unnamed protein product [Calypogeia fissa]
MPFRLRVEGQKGTDDSVGLEGKERKTMTLDSSLSLLKDFEDIDQELELGIDKLTTSNGGYGPDSVVVQVDETKAWNWRQLLEKEKHGRRAGNVACRLDAIKHSKRSGDDDPVIKISNFSRH